MDDKSVAAYLRLSEEQVRILRKRPEHVKCDQCRNVHWSYPLIRMFHSPCCTANRLCAMCGAVMADLGNGHEVGLICGQCYGGAEPWDEG